MRYRRSRGGRDELLFVIVLGGVLVGNRARLSECLHFFARRARRAMWRDRIGQRRVFIGLVLSASVTAFTADKPHPLKIKTGLWEVTTTVRSNGEIPVPAGLLEKLTPEQRARLDERRKAQSSVSTRLTVTRQCVTQRQLDHGIPFQMEKESCAWNAVASAPTKVEMQAQCSTQGTVTQASSRIEALTPESVQGTAIFSPSNGAAATTRTFTAKWQSASCTK